MTESQPVPVNEDAVAGENLLHDPSSSSVYTIGGGSPQVPPHLLQIIEHELTSSNAPSLADIQAYPTTAYFNKTVIPIIIEGLSIVAKERPTKPIEYLAAFFIKNRERFGESV
jgi:protein dpy-30